MYGVYGVYGVYSGYSFNVLLGVRVLSEVDKS